LHSAYTGAVYCSCDRQMPAAEKATDMSVVHTPHG
jgi:hypothetical protein